MHDLPILNCVAAFGVVTTHQLLERFYVQRGANPSGGYRLLGELECAGLIRVDRLHPHLGRRSRAIVSLTNDGRRIADDSWTGPNHRISTPEGVALALQYAEMRLVREAEGWEIVSARDVWRAIQAWGKLAFSAPGLTRDERWNRRFFDRPREVALPCQLLARRDRAELRFVLLGAAGLGVDRVMDALPVDTMQLLRSVERLPGQGVALHFEIVAASEGRHKKVVNGVRRWADRHRFQTAWHSVEPFLRRPNPRALPCASRRSLATSGAPNPWLTYYGPDRARIFVDT